MQENKFQVQITETADVIFESDNSDECLLEITRLEEEDKKDNQYSKGWYAIYNTESEEIVYIDGKIDLL